MGVDGYQRGWGGTFHVKQRCSGAVFSAMDSIDSKVAENRGASPCGNCCDGEWPHKGDEDEADEAGRDPETWIEKIEPEETALKFMAGDWFGPEYVGEVEGELVRWPYGFDKKVGQTSGEQVVSDLEDADITVEAVDWEDTPLSTAELTEALAEVLDDDG